MLGGFFKKPVLYIQPDPVELNYDYIVVWWTKIKTYLSPLQFYTDFLPSQMRLPIYRSLATWCLIIKQKYHNKLDVLQCGIFSDDESNILINLSIM